MENKRRHNGLVLFSCLLAIFMTFGFSFVGASTGEIDDSRVHMIYWDQNDIHTYWTGVLIKPAQTFTSHVWASRTGFFHLWS